MKKIKYTMLMLSVMLMACKKEQTKSDKVTIEEKCKNVTQYSQFNENDEFVNSMDVVYNEDLNIKSVVYSSGTSQYYSYSQNTIYLKNENNQTVARFDLDLNKRVEKVVYYNTSGQNTGLLDITRNSQGFITEKKHISYHSNSNKSREYTNTYQNQIFNGNLMSSKNYIVDKSYDTDGNLTSTNYYEQNRYYTYDLDKPYFKHYEWLEAIYLDPFPVNRVVKVRYENIYPSNPSQDSELEYVYNYSEDKYARVNKIVVDAKFPTSSAKYNRYFKYLCD